MKANASVFYPLVRDNYLDEVEVKWTGGQCDEGVLPGTTWYNYYPAQSCAAYSITDSTGAVVRQGRSPEMTCVDYESPTGELCFTAPSLVEWNGRDSAGDVVPPGTYTVTVTADGASASIQVAVATKTERDYGTVRVKRASEKAAGRGCYARASSGQMTVDCWGGGEASATFWAFIPKGAKVYEAKFVGSRLCCKRGTLDLTYKRTQSDLVEGTVTVTGWRAYAVKHFQVRYGYDRVY